MDSMKEVLITTYVNPHLFWFIINHEERTKYLQNLDKILEDISKNTAFKCSTKSTAFKVGEIVVVQAKKKLFRAIIELICSDASNNQDSSYLCWLIDFGTMIESNIVYKMPPSVQKTPPFAYQACLNNVVYIEQHLGFDKSGEATVTNASVKIPTTNSYHKSIEILSGAKYIKFKTENEDDGIFFGDVIFKDEENNEKSLRDILIKIGVLGFDEIIFKDMKESLEDYKDRNLMSIAQTCSNNKSFLDSIFETTSCDLTEACTRLKLKYYDEFENEKVVMSEDEFSAISSKHRSKANESNTSVSESKSPKSVSEVISKRKQLLQKFISQRRSLNKSDQDSLLSDSVDDSKENESLEECIIGSESESSIVGGDMKIKMLLDKIKVGKEKDAVEQFECSKPPKRKIVLYPAGGERTCFSLSTKRNKQAYKGYSFQSVTSDDSSIDTNNHFNHKSKIEVVQPSELSETQETDDPSEQDSLSDPQNGSSEKQTDMETEGDEIVSTESSVSNQDRVSTLKIKPHCSCKQCEHWTKEENVWEDGPCTLKKVSKIVPLSQQRLFKDRESAEGNTKIISLDFDSMTKVEKRAVPKLLIHSGTIPIPARDLSKLPFHRDVHRSLEQLDYKVAKLIQAYAWPALFRNQNLCMIHGPKTGKTLAYLPVICTFVLEKADRYETLSNVAGGPIVIILCGNSKKCEDVYDLAKLLTRRNWTKIQLITYPIGHVNSSHVDMVVTTPPILLEMLKSKTLTFKRLCHLVLEDGDEILDRHHEEMQRFFDLAQSTLQHRVFAKAVQLIVCSEHWNKLLAHLLRSLEQPPMVCIGNYLEAALYGTMEFSMKFNNSACKESELRALLKDVYRIHKSVIICKESEIEDVETILRLKGIDSTVVSDAMSLEEVSFREDMWASAKGGSYTVLVCTDFILNTMLTVTSANMLIHYSLPSSWTKFEQRFRCLLENCKSPLDNSEMKIVSRSIVLIDESAESKMHKFFSYIYSTELKHQLPEKLQKYAEGLMALQEEEKHEQACPLCDNVKLFGKCRDPRCRKRHTLSASLDAANALPKSGIVKFKVTFVQDVALFSVRLLQHVDCDGKLDEFDDVSDPSEDLTASLRIAKKKVRQPIVGHVYACYDAVEGVFHRAELLRVGGDDARVKLIDSGAVADTAVGRLYRLPAEFGTAVKPRAVVDAYLAGCVPPFGDDHFSARAFHHVEMMDLLEGIFGGEVVLQLGDALWLKNVCRQVELSDRVVPGCQLSREMARKDLVQHSNDQLFELYRLCSAADIVLPRHDGRGKSAKTKSEKATWHWAHLDADEVNEVTFSAAVSPDEMYVRLNKFSDLLYAFQKELQKSVAKPNYPQVESVTAGGLYLAKDPDGVDYCRVLVRRTDATDALCFYVDFGDEAVVAQRDLRRLLDAHVGKLPFQSVRCRLQGIAPVAGEWEDHVRDALYEYATEPQTDIFRTLYVKVGRKEQALETGQKRYSIFMKDGFGNKNALINMLLVDCGMALQIADEDIKDFEIPFSNHHSEESNDDVEEVIDICKKTDELMENLVGDQHLYNADEMELFLEDENDPMDFFKQIMDFGKNETSAIQSRELPPMTAAPVCDYYTPDLYWSQTDTAIRISIKLTDVEDYKLTLTKGRILNFRTVKDEKTYSLKVMFYETVHSMQHTSSGPDVRVVLAKTKAIDWPRLILSKQRARNIHYDLAKMATTDGERKRFLELPKEMGDDQSDDEVDIMYHVTSDLDSDLDFELQQDSD